MQTETHLPSTKRDHLKKLPIYFAFLLCLITLPLYAWKVLDQQSYTDFDVYYRAGERAKNLLWTEIYNLKDGASPFRYAPIWISVFRPFAEVSLKYAKLIWYFLQFIWFGLGFYWIYKTLLLTFQSKTKNPSRQALFFTCLSLLFIFRFCLDTFTIGQVSSLIFACLSYSLFAWVNSSASFTALGLLIPTLLKIGPGFMYGLFLTSNQSKMKKAVYSVLVSLLFLSFLFLLWTPSLEVAKQLWRDWGMIVVNDSNYYDASHYGSQSLKSVLLRTVKLGWITDQIASSLYLSFLGIGCLGTALFWFMRRPVTLLGRGLFFSMGLFIYIWFMPETFKYSLTPLAIPAALLFSISSLDRWTYFSLFFGIFTLSLAGKDIVGDFLFFGSQNYSIPFLATVFLGFSTFKWAWRESCPSVWSHTLYKAWKTNQSALGPWESLPSQNPHLKVSLLIPIPLNPFSSLDSQLIQNFITDAHFQLKSITNSQFEILILLYGELTEHPILNQLKDLEKQLESVRLLAPQSAIRLNGRSEALREGFLKSNGKLIFISQIEQPCHFDFFKRAWVELNSGVDLVRANRRLNESRFKIPVRFLSLVYGRHRLGLIFSNVMKLIFPLKTIDCLSGNLAFSRKLALQAFAVHIFPDLLFELELSLTSIANRYSEKDLPVIISLAGEKSAVRVLSETLCLVRGLPRIYRRFRNGYYGNLTEAPRGITADDWGLSPGVNQGILQLAQQGIVKRVSIMANSAFLEVQLKELSQIKQIELGLHFNLTYGKPLQKNPNLDCKLLEKTSAHSGNLIHSPGKFLFHWLNPFENREIKKNHVRQELKSQIEKIQSLGIQIQYLDGHHHIHLVPGLLESIVDIVRDYKIQLVRLPYDPSLWFSRKAALIFLAARAKSVLQRYEFRFLPCIYPTLNDFQDQGKLRSRLAKNLNSEVIVHPAKTNDIDELEFPDSYTEGRILEYRALQMLRSNL